MRPLRFQLRNLRRINEERPPLYKNIVGPLSKGATSWVPKGRNGGGPTVDEA